MTSSKPRHDPPLRIGQAAEILGLSVDTLRRWAESGALRASRSEGGQRLIAASEVRRLLGKRRASAPLRPIVAQSARNRFTGIVTRVVKDTVMAQVELAAGPFRVVSLMSAEAATELGLEPGVLAVASVKSTNVVIEVPARP